MEASADPGRPRGTHGRAIAATDKVHCGRKEKTRERDQRRSEADRLSDERQPGLFDALGGIFHGNPPKRYDVTPDITRNRHGGNPQSVKASKQTDKQNGCSRLENWYLERGPLGGFQEQAAIALGMRHQTASARQSDLKKNGVIVATNREGTTTSGSPAGIYVHRNFAAVVELKATA
jgi:hypothetical protein